ncbi:dienelactone hydrolase family protein [Ferrimonas pelagia]|uniref:Dienelactone hydrolase domain-containing protein n=1 Tax=Ferrimonas pelagia TaxID=1177826 RepID=A0ABP9ENF0_9GAMM
MKKWFMRILGSIALLAVVLVGGFYLGGGMTLVARIIAPSFPDFPQAQTQLVAGQQGKLYYPTQTPFDLDVLLAKGDRAEPTTGVGTLFMPEGASEDAPVPAMILLHGSGGISPGREMEYGQMLADNGYAAFVVDYYAPRGASTEINYMRRVLSVTEFDAIADSYGALKLLRTHPEIDASKIGVGGYSYGGMAARLGMDDRIRQALIGDAPGFAAHVDYYGPCFQNLKSDKITGGPLLTLRGTEDASNDLAACVEREQEIEAVGNVVEAHVYEGAGHAWEVQVPRQLSPKSPYVAGCEVQYDDIGHSSMGGTPIVDFPLETPRIERIAARMQSGSVMNPCVHYGYIIGQDDETKAKTDAVLLTFLDTYL